MIKTSIDDEWNNEIKKKINQLGKDIIKEANTLSEKPASEKENLDIIKHLVKRLAIHQLIIEKQTKRTNLLLLILSIIMAVGSILSILIYFKTT